VRKPTTTAVGPARPAVDFQGCTLQPGQRILYAALDNHSAIRKTGKVVAVEDQRVIVVIEARKLTRSGYVNYVMVKRRVTLGFPDRCAVIEEA
jgi:hypothetical protein